jgi:hypothetical protein
VWDSGDLFEQLTSTFEAPAGTKRFNGDWGSATPNGFDTRSDNKGPEPEGVAVGEAYGRRFAVVGLERIGGLVLLDITDPTAPTAVQYLNTSNFAGSLALGTAGDVSPESVAFVAAADSPTGKPLVIASYELSGTTAVFELNGPPSVSVGDVSVPEGNTGVTTANVAVTLSEASSETVTVQVDTAAATATAGSDYTDTTVTATFLPGQTAVTVPVDVLGDSVDEPNETISVTLSNPTNVLVGDPSSTTMLRGSWSRTHPCSKARTGSAPR